MNEHSATVWAALVGGFSTVMVGIIAYFGGKNNAAAVMQASINSGFKILADEQKNRNLELVGRVANLEQYVHSLENALRNAGIELPPRPPPNAVVFAPFPQGDINVK